MGARLGVLISGRGSNLQAIIDAIQAGCLDAEISIVISNCSNAAGLERARSAGILTKVLDHRDHENKESYDHALTSELLKYDIGLVCLAGFMKIVGPKMLRAFPNAILNVHPSLLPAFPGLEPQRQACDYGVKFSGATVHIVTEDLDAGPVVLQAAVPVFDDDTPETLASRILVEEHRLYPEAIARVLDGRFHLEGRRYLPD
jgi:phosphoribosylglycinamide formyltransferase-1